MRAYKAAGTDGVEGLLRDCLEEITGRSHRLMKGGPQEGRDIQSSVDPTHPTLMVESKRFGDTTAVSLDALKSKLHEAIDGDVDVWALALTREMKEPDFSLLQQLGRRHGVEVLVLDWRTEPGMLPTLGVLVAAGQNVVESRLSSAARKDMAAIRRHPLYMARLAELRERLSDPLAGFDAAVSAAAESLRVATTAAGGRPHTFRSSLNISGADSHYVPRKVVHDQLDAWWSSAADPPVALLAEEGRGKTWAALAWAKSLADRGAALVVHTSAKRVGTTDAWPCVLAAAARTFNTAPDERLERKLRRWMRGGGHFLVVIDGLNENFYLAWLDLLKSFGALQSDGRVHLMMTCRSGYWMDRVGGGILPEVLAETIPVSTFSTEEIDDYLITFGLTRTDVPSNISQWLAVPRFAELALSVRDSWNTQDEFSIGRLVMEDWRRRCVSNSDIRMSGDELVEFISRLGKEALIETGFSISRKEIYNRLSIDSGDDIREYQQTIDELCEGLWLQRATTNRYTPNEKLLPYAIGLHLASLIEGEPDRSKVDETIASFLEQLNGADIGVTLLRAAAIFLFERKGAQDASKEALLEAWVRSQNFSNSDFKEFWTLAAVMPTHFLNLAERLALSMTMATGEGGIVTKALINAAEIDVARPTIANRVSAWFGVVRLDPLDNHQNLPHAAERKAATQARWDEWNSLAVAKEFGLLSLTPNSLQASRLHLVGDAIISNNAQLPFASTLATWAVAHRVMGEFGEIANFNWVVRLNQTDSVAARDALLACVGQLRGAGGDVAAAAADLIEEALSVSKPSVGLKEHQGLLNPSWEHRADLRRFRSMALDPRASLSDMDLERARQVIAKVQEAELEDVTRTEVEVEAAQVVQARWLAADLVSYRRARYGDLATPNPERGRSILGGLVLDLPILSMSTRDQLFRLAVDYLARHPDADSKEVYHYQSFAVACLAGRSAAEQIKALQELKPISFVDSPFIAHLSAPSAADIDHVFGLLANDLDLEGRRWWLAYLYFAGSTSSSVIDPKYANVLVNFTCDPDAQVRKLALRLICVQSNPSFGYAFADSTWSSKAYPDRDEAFHGTTILLNHSQHRPFTEVRSRIAPDSLATLVEKRGCRPDEIAELHADWMSFLQGYLSSKRIARSSYEFGARADTAWSLVVQHDNASGMDELERAAGTGHLLSFLTSSPLVDFLRAALVAYPLRAAKVWNRIRDANQRASFSSSDFDTLPFQTPSNVLDEARDSVWRDLKNDEEIRALVRVVEESTSRDWLFQRLKRSLDSNSLYEIAKSVSAAGCLSKCEESDQAWKIIKAIELGGWLNSARERALAEYDLQVAAEFWRDRLCGAKTPEGLYSNRLLYNTTGDTRVPLQHLRDVIDPTIWQSLVDTNSVRRHLNDERRNASRNKLFGDAIGRGIGPWL